MSLECDKTGGTCVECGVFDFLPTRCPYCGGVYCREHLHHHRVYQGPGAAPSADSGEGEARPWCTRPEPANTLPEGADTGPRREDPLCVVCQSKYCVLVPCARCGQNFCAAHRFHGHEEDSRRAPVDTKRRKAEQGGAAEGEAATIEALCAPHTSATPLRVAPADYKSRMVEWTCLLLVPPTRQEDAHETSWHLGVCSVSAAGESSVGQNVQRLMDELPCEVAGGDGALPLLYGLGTACSGGGEGSAPSRGAPQVEVAPFTDWGAVSRLAFPPTSALVLVLATDMEAARVADVLQQTFFHTKRKDDGPDAPQDVVAPMRKDVRLNAVATRLHLHRPKATSTTPSVAADADGSANEETIETTAPEPETGRLTDTAADSEWPFQTPPPLTGRSFKGTKMQPLGAKQLGTTPRVTVAVWVEDRHLPQPLPPLCIALGKEWSLGKAQGRILEECGPSLAGAGGGAAALYLLSTKGTAPIQELTGNKVSDVLKDGDVLWLSLTGNAHGGNTALQTEVDRLRTLKGKEQSALRLEMMQKCSLM